MNDCCLTTYIVLCVCVYLYIYLYIYIYIYIYICERERLIAMSYHYIPYILSWITMIYTQYINIL